MPTLVGAAPARLSRRRRSACSPSASACRRRDSWIDMSVLEDCLRDDLNERAERRIAVLDPVKLVIDNYPEGDSEETFAPNHPQQPGARQARAAVHARAVDRARRLQRAAAERLLPPDARRRSAAALRVHRPVHRRRQGRSGQRHRGALHLRSGHAQRHAGRRHAQGQGQHPLAVGRARRARRGAPLRPPVRRCRFRARAAAKRRAPVRAQPAPTSRQRARRGRRIRRADRAQLPRRSQPGSRSASSPRTSSRRSPTASAETRFQFERHGYFVADSRRIASRRARVQSRGDAARFLGEDGTG